MQTSQETTNLFKALIQAAPEIQSISKSKQAYGYKYATLDSLIDMLKGVLPKHGLHFVQSPEDGAAGNRILETCVIHDSGEWLKSSITLTDTELQGKANDTQKFGASLTYFRRYVLSALFGVAADEDVDGNVVNMNNAARPKPKPQQQPQQLDERAAALQAMTDDWSRRIKAGETKESITKHYADILKVDVLKPSKELTTRELVVLTRELAKENANAQQL